MDILAKKLGVEVKIGENLVKNAVSLILESGFEVKKCLLVTDNAILKNCSGFFDSTFFDELGEVLILEEARPNEENVEQIVAASEDFEGIIALGSGVISDLCKYSSFKAGKKYLIFTTAASMNGYLSQNSSIIVNGHRKTLAAHLPKAVFCDYDLLKSAPKQMTKAGIGDIMCFYSCWFDWLLSHLLLETEYKSECFDMLAEKMGEFVGGYQDLVLGDDELLKIMMEILLLSGASMTLAGGSYPASQSEHLIAHSYSMKYPEKADGVLHGLQIATTTLTSAKIQEELLSMDEICVRDLNFDESKMSDFFGSEIAGECKGDYRIKSQLISQNVRRLNQELATDWMDYCKVLSRIFVSESNLREIFQHFSIATGHEALGLDYSQYNEVVGYARFVRDRFTCLDL